jgi:hypothetical protein
MVLHRVGSAAGRKACAGSNPALSATGDLRFAINIDLKFQFSNFKSPMSGSGLRAILNS